MRNHAFLKSPFSSTHFFENPPIFPFGLALLKRMGKVQVEGLRVCPTLEAILAPGQREAQIMSHTAKPPNF